MQQYTNYNGRLGVLFFFPMEFSELYLYIVYTALKIQIYHA